MNSKFESSKFDYNLAFSRNLGWLHPHEQKIFRQSKVAIAGMGGVGGIHLLTLARLGVGRFHIADFDTFEIQNFNRQAGADLSTIGKSKVEVMEKKALLINPELEIKSFTQGITEENLDSFLDGVSVYVDGLDVFELDLRQKIFQACHDRGIFIVTVAPVGMGAACITFDPRGMSPENFFGFGNRSQIEKYCRFVVGFAPHFLHLSSLVDRSFANAYEKKAPSLPMGCELAAGVMGSEVLKIILKRRPQLRAPWSCHFDAASYRFKKDWRPLGSKSPLFRLKVWFMLSLLNRERRRVSGS